MFDFKILISGIICVWFVGKFTKEKPGEYCELFEWYGYYSFRFLYYCLIITTIICFIFGYEGANELIDKIAFYRLSE